MWPDITAVSNEHHFKSSPLYSLEAHFNSTKSPVLCPDEPFSSNGISAFRLSICFCSSQAFRRTQSPITVKGHICEPTWGKLQKQKKKTRLHGFYRMCDKTERDKKEYTRLMELKPPNTYCISAQRF